MSISSTGIYGNTSLLNSEIYTDLIDDISQNTFDINDISLNKNFIQQLQSVDYAILLANAPAQWTTPVIQTGYNTVVVNSDGVNIITQNFGHSSKVNSSLLQINSEDALDETTKIITKGLSFKNAIDNKTHLIINNDGLFIQDLSDNEIISLQDWMTGITKIIKILGGIDGEGYALSDLISDTVGGVITIGGLLSSVGFFCVCYHNHEKRIY
jgi:hypothetical protein